MDFDSLTRVLRERLAQDEPDRDELPPRASAVLLPLVTIDGAGHVLLTRRSRSLGSHPGQISLPGGRVDPDDTGPRAAALRENEEEVGIRPDHVEVLGHLTEYETYHGILISVYVGIVHADEVPRHPASEEEVDEVFFVPFDGLVEPIGGDPVASRPGPDAHGPRIYDVVEYEGRRMRGDTRRRNVVHYWHLADDTTLWGITGEVVARMLAQSVDWSPPRPAVDIDELEQFMPGVRPPA